MEARKGARLVVTHVPRIAGRFDRLIELVDAGPSVSSVQLVRSVAYRYPATVASVRLYEQTQGVYFDDLDPFHILHNARYVLLFERTLGAFWMELGFGAFQDTTQPEQFHLVARNETTMSSPCAASARCACACGSSGSGRAP